MLKSAYEGLNARPKVYLSKEYFCKMYPTCVSSKLCEFFNRRANSYPLPEKSVIRDIFGLMKCVLI